MALNLKDFGGVEGQARLIAVPVTFTYTDGSSEQKTIRFNYNGGGGSGGDGGNCTNSEWRDTNEFTCTGCGQKKTKQRKYCDGVATNETRLKSFEERESDCNTRQYCTSPCNRGTPYQFFDGNKYGCRDGGAETCSSGYYDMNNQCTIDADCKKLFCNCDYEENSENTENCEGEKVRVRVCKGGDPRHDRESGDEGTNDNTSSGCGFRQERPPECNLTDRCNTPE